MSAARAKKRRSGSAAVRSPRSAADLAFFGNLFASIAEEMGVSLVRSAYSPNIKERRDCSCAVFDDQGRLIAQAAHIPVHLGAMPASVRTALHTCAPLGDSDAVLLNDPFAGGTHLPDLTLVTPVYLPQASARRRRQAVAYLASRAHHADIGGLSPGSLPLSQEIYQEGLRLPPLKLREGGRINQAVVDILCANSRTPEERGGDLRAQLAAHDVGAARLQECFKSHGPTVLYRQMAALLSYGERLMADLISRIPDGTYTHEDFLDDDGLDDRPIKIRATIRIRRKRATVDFAGSDPACRGNVNAVEAITCSAVYYCFLSLLVTASSSETGVSEPPINAGCFMPIRVLAPENTVVNALPPHAVACGNLETSQRIVDVVFGALAAALPQWIPAASQGTMNNVAIGRADADAARAFAYYETIAGGMGARPIADGLDGVQVHMTNTRNTPIEALELSCPLRVERYELIAGSGGRGRYRGGNGLRRDLRVLCDASGSLLSDRRRRPPPGIRGGRPARPGKNLLIRHGRARRLPGKVQLQFQRGDVLSVRTPGGGGWGRSVNTRRSGHA